MRLLLDTHFAVWMAVQRQRLRASELALLSDPTSELCISAVSIWEIRLKWNSYFKSGERKGPCDPAQLLILVERMGVDLLPLLPAHAATELAAPIRYKDPFDEQLLIHAQQLGMRLLTRDQKLASHPLALVI